MAYAVVSSVSRKLVHLQHSLCRVIDTKKLQVRRFIETLHQLPGASNCFSFRKYMKEALDEANRGDIEEEITKRLAFDSIYQLHLEERYFLKSVPEIGEIYLLDREIKKLSEIYAEGMSPLFNCSSTISQGKCCDIRSELHSVLLASVKLKEETTFFHVEAMQVERFCENLRILRAFLRDSSDLCKNHEMGKHLEECISNMANKAEDFLEEKLLDNYFECQWFHKEKGILPGLCSAFEKIDSIKQKVLDIYDETIGIRNLHSGSISMKGSRHASTKEDIVVGINDVSEIVDGLTRQRSQLDIVTIVGMGGIGKTTLARKVFNHPFVVYHFHCRAWVTVSRVYQVRDLLLHLLLSFTRPTDKIYEMNKEQLAEYLFRSLRDSRYLIVMDDIWSIKAWDDVKRSLPDDKNGSRVLSTSRLRSVAVSLNPRMAPYCMNLLDMNESWKLLQRKVFGRKTCPPELTDVGKQIVKKCQGLPLAIVVVGGYLSHIKWTYECWRDIAENINSLLVTDPEQCLEILALSYDRLPHHLKACYLYMGAFPEDCEIEVQKMINLWVAEGFLEPKYPKTLEEVGEDYLEDLIDRSLVLAGKRSLNGRIKTCFLHDLLHELCLRKAQKEKFMHVMKRDSQGSVACINTQRRLSIHLDIQSVPSIPLLRSFLYFSVGSGFMPDILFFQLRFKLIRVLDISFLRFTCFPVQILELVLLSYLSLCVTYELPASIFELKNLQTLIIHGPWIKKQQSKSTILSLAYWNMPWLRHLHVSVPCYLKDAPIADEDPHPLSSPHLDAEDVLSSPYSEDALVYPHLYHPLSSPHLQTLSRIRFASCTKEVFALMPHLKKLGICETKDDYNSLWSSKCLGDLLYLQHLEELKCSFYKQNRISRQICLDVFPSTIKQLNLSWSFMPWEDMTPIAMLPNLEVLKLKNYAFRGPEWSPAEDGFHHLKYLLIEKTDLKHWEASSFHFPSLERLVLRFCDFLEEIPFSVGEIPTLELIELCHCSNSAEVSAEEIKEQIDGVEVRIQRKSVSENHLKRTSSYDYGSLLQSKKPMTSSEQF